MKKHVKLYHDHFMIEPGDWIGCEVCDTTAVDIHHIEPRGMGGSKSKDDPINIFNEAINNITGTLHDESGNVIGDADSVLVETLAPRSQVWRSRDRLSTSVGDTWNGTATLKINAPPAALKLLNLNYINDETFFNFSCYESATSQAESSSALVPTPAPRYGY